MPRQSAPSHLPRRKKPSARRCGLGLSHEHKPRSYEGPQLSYNRKMTALDVAETILRALGPYPMFDDDTWGPLKGLLEVNQRSAVVGLHPGGTTDVQKVIMSRRIGIGRTVQEQVGRLR